MSRSEFTRPPITIDGSSASGKSSVGQALARRVGYKFLDTGLMYRVATLNALQNGVDIGDSEAVTAATLRMKFAVEEGAGGETLIMLDGLDVTGLLHSTTVDGSVSPVAAIPRVREIMVAEQRRLGGAGEIVMVGRDIGTVVIPDAPLKIYLIASARTRAIRRHRDFIAEGTEVDLADILSSIEKRDLIDSSREDSPLKPADDARVIDTDDLSFDQVVEKLVELAKEII